MTVFSLKKRMMMKTNDDGTINESDGRKDGRTDMVLIRRAYRLFILFVYENCNTTLDI